MGIWSKIFRRFKSSQHSNEVLSDQKKANVVSVPVYGNGRLERASFQDNFDEVQAIYDTVNPDYPVSFLDLLPVLAMAVPDISQTVSKMTVLANTGHSVQMEGTERAISEAQDRINILSRTGFGVFGGSDGLINALLRQIAVLGTLSLEWVPDLSMKGIAKARLIKVKNVRFRKATPEELKLSLPDYAPYLIGSKGQIINLNAETYSYIPLQLGEGSPYAIPTLIAAIDPTMTQRKALENVNYILEKMGLLGFVKASFEPLPRRGSESESEWQARLERYLKDMTKALQDNYRKGLLASFSNMSIDHTNVASDARGAIDLFNMNEMQLASGSDIDPALWGRSYSTTETYAGVAYNAWIGKLANVRRLVKRGIEKGYNFDMVLGGVPAEIRLKFNPLPRFNPKEAAETEKTEVETIIAKENQGWIDSDQAAQEAGYDKAAGKKDTNGQSKNKLAVVLDFDKEKEKYIHKRERIEVKKKSA